MRFSVANDLRVGPFRYQLTDAGFRVSRSLVGLFMGRGPAAWRVGHMSLRGRDYPLDTAAIAVVPPGEEPGEVLFKMNTRRKPAPGGPRTLVILACVWALCSVGLFLAIERGPGWLAGVHDPSTIEAGAVPLHQQWRRDAGQWLQATITADQRRQLQDLSVGGLALSLFSLLLVPVAVRRYQYGRTAVLLYPLASDALARYERLFAAFEALSGCNLVWLSAKGRRPVNVVISTPEAVATNVSVPSFRVGASGVFFFPDRVIVEHGDLLRSAGYDQFAMVLVPGERAELHVMSSFLEARIEVADASMAEGLPRALQGMDPSLSRS